LLNGHFRGRYQSELVDLATTKNTVSLQGFT